MYKRTGTCNQCGECCGFPRKTDGVQINPWPTDLIKSTRNWSPESIELYFPILNIIDKTEKLDGKQCPFLSTKLSNDTVPCLLYGTKDHRIWEIQCKNTPPLLFITKEQLELWNTNCPSCSYAYKEEK